ncbi:MAG: hypothetical protein ACI3WR_07915 [Oscillospiraceae bacterium]
MEKRETRWYILWFFAAGLWLINFCISLQSEGASFITGLKFCNIWLSLAAGIVNARRYKARSGKSE